jgi:hypothetical protein
MYSVIGAGAEAESGRVEMSKGKKDGIQFLNIIARCTKKMASLPFPT